MPPAAFSLIETQPPGAEPLTLDDIKDFLRVTHDGEDAGILSLVRIARSLCEETTGLSLITRQYSLFLDHWPGSGPDTWWDGVREGARVAARNTMVTLPRAPLAAVGAVRLHDDAGGAETLDAETYFVDTASRPGRIVFRSGQTPPHPLREANGIEISFTAGFGAAPENIPPALAQGMRQIVAHLFENRGDAAVNALALSGAGALFQPFRTMSLL